MFLKHFFFALERSCLLSGCNVADPENRLQAMFSLQPATRLNGRDCYRREVNEGEGKDSQQYNQNAVAESTYYKIRHVTFAIAV
jgi:hypothetical protein